MIPATIKNPTNILRPPQNWDPTVNGECAPLIVRVSPYGDSNIIQSAWMPSEVELAKLNAGEPVILSIFGEMFPPVSLHVGDEDPSTTGVAANTDTAAGAGEV